MRNPYLFFGDLAKQPLWVPVWVAMLALVNLCSLYFWPAPLAQVIFITFMASAVMMMALYSWFGFEKILGLGHVLWIFLLPYTFLHLKQVDDELFLYLVILSIFLAISLVFDVVDAWKYFNNSRG